MANFAPGDIIAFGGTDLLGAFINVVTYGVPGHSAAHVGIVAKYGGRLRLFESTLDATEPCVIRNTMKPGVRAVALGRRISRYVGRVWHYPLSRPLYEHESKRLTRYLLAMLGRDYDELGAVRTGGWLLAKTKAGSGRPDLSRLFCSELVAAAHNEIGIFPTGNPSGFSPNRLLRTERMAGVLRKQTEIR